MEPFEPKLSIKPSFFNKDPDENLAVSINNTLCQVDIDQIPDDIVSRCLIERGEKKLSSRQRNALIEIFTLFLAYHLGNSESKLNDYEAARKMQKKLTIEESAFNECYYKIAESKIDNRIRFLLGDKFFTEDEEASLILLQTRLNVSNEKVNNILKQIRTQMMNEKFHEIGSDGRISPTEEEDFIKQMKDLRVTIVYSNEDLDRIAKMKALWRFENEPLPEVPVSILLQKTERCYFQSPVTLLETRAVNTRVNYFGPTARIRIMKGVYYRLGSVNVRPKSEQKMTKIDDGMIYITNKRILFVGSSTNRPIMYSQIIDFEVCSDGISIVKESGKSPIFMISSDAPLAGAILAKCIKDSVK
ncbi:MAG: hypothetical protein Q8N39_04355 [Pelolinea sp.]|nr:hypothetical protein [Pelolinea sp.]